MTHAGTSPWSMNRRLFLRSTCPLLLFPVSAMTSEGATKKGQTIMYKIPLLEVIEKTAIRHKALVNGFDTGLLISVRSNQKKQVSGLKTKLTSYCALHPYFLKRGANELRLEYTLDPSYAAPEDRGPWTLDCRVASINYAPGKELGTTFAEKELLRLTSPALRKGKSRASRRALAAPSIGLKVRIGAGPKGKRSKIPPRIGKAWRLRRRNSGTS